MNLRDAFYTSYSLSRGAPSASWVLPQVDGKIQLAERVGFEPTDAFTSPVFKTGAFNRSAISPDNEFTSNSQTQELYYHIEVLFVNIKYENFHRTCSLLLCAKELISSDALIFLRRNGGEAMKYECLKLEERRIIEEMYAKGAKPGEIAERVGKCQATIYRELERGKTGETDSRFRQGYSAAVAEARVNRSYRNRGRRKAAQ